MVEQTPDQSFVRDLQAFDSKLRVRWARHSERWFVERKLDSRHPQLVSEQPAPDSAGAVAKDLYEGWQQGYVHVVTVRPQDLHWQVVREHLAKYDAWRMGGMTKIADQLEAQDETKEASQDRHIDNRVEDMTDDAYEMIAWRSGRRVALREPEPPLIDTGEGFKIRDRRRFEADRL